MLADAIVATNINIPHSREAEEAAIACVLINPQTFHEIRTVFTAKTTADEFYIHRLRFVWEAFERLAANDQPIDSLTVSEELDDFGRLDEIGGPAYLTALLNQVPTTLNAAAYAEIIHSCYVRRQILSAANEIATNAYNAEISLDKVSGQSAHALNQAIRLGTTKRVVSLSDSVRVVDAQAEERAHLEELPGIPTGLIDLDKKLGGGAQDSDLLLIAARPGHGKTSLLLQIARHAANYTVGLKAFKKRVAIFSLEMPHQQLTTRLISQMTGIDFQLLRAGRVPELKLNDYYAAIAELSQMDIVIDDTPAATPTHIRSRCEILAAQGLDLVVVDYLGLMKSEIQYRQEGKEVDYLATELKNIAREFSIPVWVAHQMNRNVEYRSKDSKPQLSDLRDAGEQPTDVVIFIHGDEDDAGNLRTSELLVRKHRNGPTGEIPVVFLPQFTRFENAVRIQL